MGSSSSKDSINIVQSIGLMKYAVNLFEEERERKETEGRGERGEREKRRQQTAPP
jgi:hypothetical protein